jgi:hypothetical protein
MLTKFIAILVLLWAGMILGISFLESWAKFRTPNLSKAIGLEVGRTVFDFFHKTQCGLLLIIITISLFAKCGSVVWLIIASLTVILTFQLVGLFPMLSRHVDRILSGGVISASLTHTLYGICEMSKFMVLILLGVNLMA